MSTPKAPTGLAARGRRLWREMHAMAEFNPAERVLLEEACRIADRLERLDTALRGEAEFLRVETDRDGDLILSVDGAMAEARQQSNVLKQLVAALRIPDEQTGKRPQRRGARGAYKPRKAGESAKDRLKAV